MWGSLIKSDFKVQGTTKVMRSDTFNRIKKSKFSLYQQIITFRGLQKHAIFSIFSKDPIILGFWIFFHSKKFVNIKKMGTFKRIIPHLFCLTLFVVS